MGMPEFNFRHFLYKSGIQCELNINKISYLCIQVHGVDWFRQQDQWVSKHAENRSAISLIPCCKLLTGNEEFALAA